MASSPPASPGGHDHEPPNVAIDVPPSSSASSSDPPAHPPPTRLPSVRFSGLSPALPYPLSPVGDSPPSALPLSSPSPDSDCFDEARLYEFLTPQQQTISRSRTIFTPRMTQRESVLATPYGPDAPMTLSSAPFSELIEYNYSFIPSIGQSWKKMAGRLQARLHLPYLPWWGNRGCAYLKQDVWHDALAGLTCAVLVIPESLSYMVLASLAPVVGLYTAAVSPFAYALLGTSPHVSVGPISLVSLYLPSVFKSLGYPVEDRTAEGKQLRREVASVVAFYVCVVFAVMSFFRLGGLIRFLSHSVMAGFVCASGLFVAIKGREREGEGEGMRWSGLFVAFKCRERERERERVRDKKNSRNGKFEIHLYMCIYHPSLLSLLSSPTTTVTELKHILDLRPPESTFTHNYQVIFWLVTHLNETDLTSLALGGSALFVLLTVKYLKRRFPATPERLQSRPFLVWYYVSSFSTLIVVLVGQVVSQALSKRGSSLHVLGSLPSGLSLPSPPLLSQFPAGRMLAQAFPIAILAYVEAVSIAKKYSAVYGYKLDLNQDLAGYSLANLLSCMWGGVTPSGSFARTALSAEVGARTSFANIFTGSFVIICLYNTEVLYHIPYCVLGALVESAMMNLISFHEFYHALRIARTSGLIMVFTFLVTLLWSVEDGLLYGIMASLALLLYQLSDVVRRGGNEGGREGAGGEEAGDAKTATCELNIHSPLLPLPFPFLNTKNQGHGHDGARAHSSEPRRQRRQRAKSAQRTGVPSRLPPGQPPRHSLRPFGWHCRPPAGSQSVLWERRMLGGEDGGAITGSGDRVREGGKWLWWR